MTEEEAEAAEAAIQALHLPLATDEEVAEATYRLEVGERHRQIVAEAQRPDLAAKVAVAPVTETTAKGKPKHRPGLTSEQAKAVAAVSLNKWEVPPEELLMVFSFLVGRARSPESGGLPSPGIRRDGDTSPLPWSTAAPALHLL